ncbi:MAG: glycosyltransferase, partial [Candidatus Omnitrophica bacterium]|nr:glycosyltransferase [Candidatus Omnitrophota bacterium]
RKTGIDIHRLRIIQGVPFENMPEYLRIADAGLFFINPYKKIGSSPIKLGEFLSSGVPVIINPGVGDTEEIVREGNVGVVVENFTADDYKKAVERLLILKEEGEVLRRRCRDIAKRYLSLDEAVTKYARIYDALLGAS